MAESCSIGFSLEFYAFLCGESILECFYIVFESSRGKNIKKKIKYKLQ